MNRRGARRDRLYGVREERVKKRSPTASASTSSASGFIGAARIPRAVAALSRRRSIGSQPLSQAWLALFRLALAALLALGQGQRLLECLTHLVELLVMQVVDALAALGAEVDQLVVVAHDGDRIKRNVRFRRGAHGLRVFAT